MKTALKTAPTGYPVSIKEAKEHLRLEIGDTYQDDYLETLIQAATKNAEMICKRRLITQTWYYYLEQWPCENYITIPFGQLQSVTSIKYKETDASESTWTASEYIVETTSDPGRVVLDYGESYPGEALYPSNPITIEYVCGYGTSSSVPAGIKHAMKVMMSDTFENRESEITGMSAVTSLPTIRNLLRPYIIN